MNSQGNTIWINGTFDVLHAGHVKMFQLARKYGGVVIVGIDDDKRVTELKGPTRPINTLQHRIEVLEAIKYIDLVVPFGSEEEMIRIINHYSPEELYIGEEYEDKRIVGRDLFEVITYIPKHYGLSSTQILENGKKI